MSNVLSMRSCGLDLGDLGDDGGGGIDFFAGRICLRVAKASSMRISVISSHRRSTLAFPVVSEVLTGEALVGEVLVGVASELEEVKSSE